ncbi:ParB N-terminal domain-containing protein [Peptostreptococcus sp. D1]|uniref:ParB N-terminal domain-containing protein n=1 Tax=Peptostreptococcus sp. D1 TaxID=72304 RepID=UPI0008F0EBEA|nr:ParB N-terminal domain-containing protein [Peptostreptococcus sp. D1]SFE90150.1 ParB-like nuclease domain-containing protein [Peptostreptococcus sp. D1]
MSNKLQIINVTEIIPYENNPRINDHAIDKVIESIKEFGFTNPILLDKDNVIIAGHTRYEAALRLNYSQVPCIYLNNLSEEQVKAYRLVDNKTSEFAEWDFDKLMQELDKINDIDLEMYNLNSINFDELNLTDEDFIKDEPLKTKEKEKQIIYCPSCNEKIEL